MAIKWACKHEDCSMKFPTLRRLNFHREVNHHNSDTHPDLPLPGEGFTTPFACEVCLNLCKYPSKDIGAGTRRNWANLGVKVANLKWSSREGCQTCEALLKGLQHCDLYDEKATIDLATDYTLVWAPSKPVGSAETRDGDFSSFKFILVDFFRTQDMSNFKPPVLHRLPVHHLTSEDTGSLVAFQTISKWLENCTMKHVSCRALTESNLPRRVLDLFPDFTNSNPSDSLDIKLSQTNNEFARYVCLSHCWGSLQPIMTTSATITKHEERISWSTLPRTFQDAVHFTRRLGMRYLWIDSLCIIQDDKADWEREASNMCSIYESSFLTIAATHAKGANDGLYSKTPTESQALQIHASENNPAIGNIYARRELSHRLGIFRQDDTTPPLMKRAWVYQEMLLSPRTLHFTADELVWNCNEGSCCECQPEFARYPWWGSNGAQSFSKTDHYLSLHPPRNASTSSTSKQNLSIIFRWHQVVQEYSGLQLTYASDRLPALAGIATQMSNLTGYYYMHGLWRENLVLDLLWYADINKINSLQRLPEPSWSWASLPSVIKYVELSSAYGDKIQYEIDLLEPETGANNDTILVNNAATLKLSGKLCFCAIRTKESSEETKTELWIDDTLLTSFNPDQILSPSQLSDCYCFLLAQCIHPPYMDGDLEVNDVSHYGLVLEVVSWDSRVFRRVGMFRDEFGVELGKDFPEFEKQVITIV